MANDFKRMWTKEEIGKLGSEAVATQTIKTYFYPYIPTKNDPPFLKVGNTLFYKAETKYHINETFIFNKVLDINESKEIGGVFIWENVVYYNIIFDVRYGGAVKEIKLSNSSSPIWYNGEWKVDNKKIDIISFDNYDDELYLENFGIFNSIDKEYSTYSYVNVANTGELEQAIPTDVSIIEDQGKLELMLEHDGNVLAVNDTPNQFLQRRLDKPSAEWSSNTSSEDFETWLNGVIGTIYIGQIMKMPLDTENYYIVTVVTKNAMELTPLSFVFYTFGNTNGYVTHINIDIPTNRITIDGRSFDGTILTNVLSFIDLPYFRLY